MKIFKNLIHLDYCRTIAEAMMISSTDISNHIYQYTTLTPPTQHILYMYLGCRGQGS